MLSPYWSIEISVNYVPCIDCYRNREYHLLRISTEPKITQRMNGSDSSTPHDRLESEHCRLEIMEVTGCLGEGVDDSGIVTK